MSFGARAVSLALVLLPVALAIPAAAPTPTPVQSVEALRVVALAARITDGPILARDPAIIEDIESNIGGLISGIRSDLTAVYTKISGVAIPDFLNGFPSGDDVKSELGFDDDDEKSLDAQPTQVLNLP